MQDGIIHLKWDTLGKLEIKTSLQMNSSESKQLAMQILLDAAKTINSSGTPLLLANGPVRVLGGN